MYIFITIRKYLGKEIPIILEVLNILGVLNIIYWLSRALEDLVFFSAFFFNISKNIASSFHQNITLYFVFTLIYREFGK
jgi:hypothetical protein